MAEISQSQLLVLSIHRLWNTKCDSDTKMVVLEVFEKLYTRSSGCTKLRPAPVTSTLQWTYTVKFTCRALALSLSSLRPLGDLLCDSETGCDGFQRVQKESDEHKKATTSADVSCGSHQVCASITLSANPKSDEVKLPWLHDDFIGQQRLGIDFSIIRLHDWNREWYCNSTTP